MTRTPMTVHYLIVPPCDHTDCDGPEECPGYTDWGWTIECEATGDENCRWRCDPCGEAQGEWFYNGKGWCSYEHQMDPCPCLIVDWFTSGGFPLYEVMDEPRVGRHPVLEDWDGGYSLHYMDSEYVTGRSEFNRVLP